MTIAESQTTGSLMNTLMARQTIGQPTPKVGMGATLLGWTDRYAATITAYEGGILTVREDHVKRTDQNGMSDMQTYDYSPNPDGFVYHYRFENGVWSKVEFNERTGLWRKADGYGLKIGVRDHYYDFSF